MHNNEDTKDDSEGVYLIGDPFDSEHKYVIEKYGLKNYMIHKNMEEWNTYSDEDKLKHCYALFDVLEKDEFSIFRQAEVFQKLIHVDFRCFFYENVMECIFTEYQNFGVTLTTQIPFNPLVPQKYYVEYFKKLKQESGVGHLQIPLEDSANYLKELLHIWYLHKYKGLTAYAIAKHYYDLEQQKYITRTIKSIQNLYNLHSQ